MRMQLALNVDDLEKAIEYYSAMFGVPLNKREPGYANFVVPDHNLKLVLFEAPGAERLNHVGFEVFSDEAVDRTASHLKSVDLLDEKQAEEVCCYACQNKAVAYDPQGLMWEWYRVLEDSPTFYEDTPACCAEPEASASGEPKACCA